MNYIEEIHKSNIKIILLFSLMMFIILGYGIFSIVMITRMKLELKNNPGVYIIRYERFDK